MAAAIASQIMERKIFVCYHPFGDTGVKEVLNDADRYLREWREDASGCMTKWAETTYLSVLSKG